MMSGVVMLRWRRPGEGGRLELMPAGDDLAQLLNQSVGLGRDLQKAPAGQAADPADQQPLFSLV